MAGKFNFFYDRPAKFFDLYKISFKKNPLLDYKKVECYLSILVSFVSVSVLFLLYFNQSNLNSTTVLQNLCLYIGAALVGMLGFIVSGLAIISGTLSGKVIKNIDKAGQFDSLIGIMFSFYFIGLVIGILAVLFFLVYLVLSISFNYMIYVYLILSFVLSYGFSFVILYSVSLLGTCINMFILNYKYSSDCCNYDTNDRIDQGFLDARIDAITSLIYQKGYISREEFLNELEQRIEKDNSDEIKDMIIEKMKKYYKS